MKFCKNLNINIYIKVHLEFYVAKVLFSAKAISKTLLKSLSSNSKLLNWQKLADEEKKNTKCALIKKEHFWIFKKCLFSSTSSFWLRMMVRKNIMCYMNSKNFQAWWMILQRAVKNQFYELTMQFFLIRLEKTAVILLFFLTASFFTVACQGTCFKHYEEVFKMFHCK